MIGLKLWIVTLICATLLVCQVRWTVSFCLPSCNHVWTRRNTQHSFALCAKKPAASPKESPSTPSKPSPPPPASTKSEFPRLVHVTQIPRTKPVSCKLVAKPEERIALSARYRLGELQHLAANLTLTRVPPNRILIAGQFESYTTYSFDVPDSETHSFETVLLNNYDSDVSKENIQDADDCDDEVPIDGNIDVGEIVGEFLSLMT